MDLSVYSDVEATLDTTEEAQEVVSFVDAAENAVEMVVKVEAARRLPAAFFCTTQMIIRAKLLISRP